MTISNKKYIITNEIEWIRQLFFCFFCTFCIQVKFQLYLISHLHMRMLIYQAEVLHENFLICKYLSILHALSHLQSPMLGFHIQSFLQKPQSSYSLLSHQHRSWFYFSSGLQTLSFNLHLTNMNHVELKNFFHLSPILN